MTDDDVPHVVRVITYLAHSKERIPVRPALIIDENTQQVLKGWNGLAHVDASGPGGNKKTGLYYYGDEFPQINTTLWWM